MIRLTDEQWELAVDLPYAIANQRVEFARVEPAAIPTAFWRGVGPTHNIYVVESFIDELAAAANKDRVEYRRALLQNNPRALHVLNRAAELSGWGKPLGERRGRGISLQQTFGTFMSQVAEVTVAKSGEIRVDRVVVVVDTGIVVNPDIVTAQMQSGIIFGISASAASPSARGARSDFRRDELYSRSPEKILRVAGSSPVTTTSVDCDRWIPAN